jgi:NADPH-dependent 2,4-dienoyl-CoA reductase/sulfur reductase-like enzyme
VVSDSLLTSDPSIYAVGDVIEITDLVSGDKAMVPLAGPANKQGRIAADNIAGMDERIPRHPGHLRGQGVRPHGRLDRRERKVAAEARSGARPDYETVTISQNSHAGYYPGAVPMT